MSTFEATRQTDQTGREVLVVIGDLDLATAPKVTALAAASGGAADASPLRLDLAGITFLDSTGLGALLEVRNAVLAAGREFEIVARSAAVERVLSLAGLTDLFDAVDGGVA